MRGKLFDGDFSGMALVTVLILIIILTLLAGTLLSLQANQVRLIAHGERRTRARYAEEAAMVHQLDKLRKYGMNDSNINIDGIDVTMSIGPSGMSGIDELNFSHDYTVVF